MIGSCLGLLLTIFAAPDAVLGGEFPPFQTGRSEIAFEAKSPQSTDAQLKRRFGSKNDPPPYDIAKETFLLIVPPPYRHSDAWGLFVWIDASSVPVIPKDWEPVLAEKKLLLVATRDSGNGRSVFDRCRTAVDAVHNMKQRFHIDPERIEISGHSGGGRVASMIGVAYADVFTGAFPMMGANFYKAIPTGEPNKAWLPIYKPDSRILESAKVRNRYVMLTGENDFNRENILRVSREGFETEGFRHVLYLEVPGLGHARPSGEWFGKGIDFLDSKSPADKSSR